MVCSVTMVSIHNFAKQINNFAIYYLGNFLNGIKHSQTSPKTIFNSLKIRQRLWRMAVQGRDNNIDLLNHGAL